MDENKGQRRIANDAALRYNTNQANSRQAAPQVKSIFSTHRGRMNVQNSVSLYLPVPMANAGRPSMGINQLIQAAATQT